MVSKPQAASTAQATLWGRGSAEPEDAGFQPRHPKSAPKPLTQGTSTRANGLPHPGGARCSSHPRGDLTPPTQCVFPVWLLLRKNKA